MPMHVHKGRISLHHSVGGYVHTHRTRHNFPQSEITGHGIPTHRAEHQLTERLQNLYIQKPRKKYISF